MGIGVAAATGESFSQLKRRGSDAMILLLMVRALKYTAKLRCRSRGTHGCVVTLPFALRHSRAVSFASPRARPQL